MSNTQTTNKLTFGAINLVIGQKQEKEEPQVDVLSQVSLYVVRNVKLEVYPILSL